MSEATLAVPAPVAKDQSFLWRRLHSLTGILPIGGFMLFHLYENLAAVKGAHEYDEMVLHVNAMLPGMYFHAIELTLIGSILFHGLYGFYIGSTGNPNTNRYVYGNNWAYMAQRLSGYIAFLYIALHVGVLRGYVTLGGNHLAAYREAPGHLNVVTYNDVAAHLGNPRFIAVQSIFASPWVWFAYLVGTIAAIYHFCNGLNGFTWTWGLAVGRVAQKRVQMAAWGLFVVLTAMTVHMLYTLRFA